MHRPHKHLILDGFVKCPPTNEAEAKKELAKIIEDIGMVVAKLSNDQPNPIAWYCDDPDNRGLTAGGILTTSHIVMHIWDVDHPAPFHFDLYSCSDFEVDFIVNRLNELYDFTGEVYGYLIDRNGRSCERVGFNFL